MYRIVRKTLAHLELSSVYFLLKCSVSLMFYSYVFRKYFSFSAPFWYQHVLMLRCNVHSTLFSTVPLASFNNLFLLISLLTLISVFQFLNFSLFLSLLIFPRFYYSLVIGFNLWISSCGFISFLSPYLI